MKYLILAVALAISGNANARWLDTSGEVTAIATYASTETILVTISAPGVDVAECSNKDTFAIGKGLSVEARARMYSMLLAAQASGRKVVISYSDVGGCEPWGSNLNAYRVIQRLR